MTSMTVVRRGILTAALLACVAAPIFASTFTVTTTADSGPGSLRDAISNSNAQGGANTIVLGNGVAYTLTTGVLHITSSVTLEGNGSVVDGGLLDRVFDIEGTGVTVVINSLTIRNGKASGFLSIGGGVFIRNANVTLNNSTVTGNGTAVEFGLPDDGGGIAAVGTFDASSGTVTPAVLTLSNTTVSGNSGANGGGLVCVLCQLFASNAAFTGNTSAAGDGAGIMLVGDASTAQITSSAFTGNVGAARGGGLATSAGTPVVTVTRTRFASNGAPLGGGLFNNAASVTATNNWWGCNFGPGAGGTGCTGTADSAVGVGSTTPFLVLNATASPASIEPSTTSTLTADLRSNSDGVNVSSGGVIPDSTIATFSATLGTFAQSTIPTSGGEASDLFMAGATGGPASLSVSVDNQTVSAPVQIATPQMSLDQTSLTFNATSNSSAFVSQTGTQTLQLTQTGPGLVTWTAASNVPWLVVSPSSGSGSAMLHVSVQFAPGLAATQSGSITLTFTGSGNSPGPINASLNVVTLPQMSIDQSALVFSATSNGTSFVSQTAAQTIQLTQTGAGLVTWTAVSSAPWLVVSPASGSGSAPLSVSVQFVPALAGTQAGSITLTFTGAGNTAGPIGVTLNTVTLPTVSVDRTSLLFGATTNGSTFLSQTGTQVIHLTQSGAGSMTWTATSTAPWLVVSPASGSGSATLNVSVQFASGLGATQGGSINLAFTGAGNTAGPISVTLKTTNAPAAPFGGFDTPADGSTGLAGSIAITGWALDDLQVIVTAICRDAVPAEPVAPDVRCGNEPRIFVGDATFVDGARPDVQAQFPNYPLSSRAGWGYLLLTNFLPNLGNGAFNLYAYASDADGNTTLLGRKTITCANSGSLLPFGAIDTPAQGETVSGSVDANFGWVLAPAPIFADPPDGGSVSVMVDGLSVGSPGAWNARPDLTALFPAAQYPGISKALGVFGLDTTGLADGLHTIAWIVTSNAGATVGVGSRYFTVANGALMLSSRSAGLMAGVAAENLDRLPVDQLPISGRRGFDLTAPLENYGAAGGSVIVQAEELDRIELHLGTVANSRYSGYMRTRSGLASLPVGSQLDLATGVFVWQAGVGFVGAYEFVFVRSVNGQAVAYRDVEIVLNPMHSTRVGAQTMIDVPGRAADGGPTVVSAAGFVVSGWAADVSSTVDNGVDVVHVWATRLDGGAAESDPVFIGPALVNGSRPDVAAIYGSRFGQSGYGIVVRGLAPGTYDIAVFAYSTESHAFAPARTVRVVVR
jgi:hypothetical protein